MQPKLFNNYLGDADLQNYLPVNQNTSFETLAPHLGLAEQNFIIPLLGRKLYNQLVDIVPIADQDSGSGSASGSGSGSGSASGSVMSVLGQAVLGQQQGSYNTVKRHFDPEGKGNSQQQGQGQGPAPTPNRSSLNKDEEDEKK